MRGDPAERAQSGGTALTERLQLTPAQVEALLTEPRKKVYAGLLREEAARRANMGGARSR